MELEQATPSATSVGGDDEKQSSTSSTLFFEKDDVLLVVDDVSLCLHRDLFMLLTELWRIRICGNISAKSSPHT